MKSLNEPTRSEWRSASVYTMAAVCLVLGTLVGYLLRGSATPSAASIASSQSDPVAAAPATPQMPSLEDMKRMADKQAEPVLEKLKTDPQNPELLIQVGAIYQSTHRFKEAVAYYQKSLDIKPHNLAVRTQAATCLYYSGDVDGALAQLDRALKDDPRNANVLFNLGVMKWQGKQDSQGALKAWQKLLETNPKLDAAKKSDVEKVMAEVRQHGKPGFDLNEISRSAQKW